jgi:2-keto-4-pentenoate hydratase
VSSRIAGWDITIVDTVADNASAGGFVVGLRPVSLFELDLHRVEMRMTSSDGTVVSSGTGGDCLGHPVNAVVWLANTLARLGAPLKEGDLVLSGALGPMVTVGDGDRYEADFGPLGSVGAEFGLS